MNIKGINYNMRIAASVCLLSGSVVYAGTMGEVVEPVAIVYAGAFGGGGSISSNDIKQQGTAFYPEISGGPLAVNALGQSSSDSMWIAGGHVGYQWAPRSWSLINPGWTFAPAAELEGYYLGGTTISGDDLNNGTTRLTEHDFFVKYPLHTGVFLANAILNLNAFESSRFHPYVGIGAGAAVISVSGASSIQKAPAEPGVNHYNSDVSDTSVAFAAQPKVGLSYNFSQNVNLFVEYRFLYLSATDYTFGSTVYPGHFATSNWDAKIGSQYYDMGTVGIQFDL